MYWLYLSLASGILVATKNVITRKLVFQTDRWTILYSKYLFVSLFALLLIFFTGIPEIRPAFYYSIVIASVLDVIAAWCFLNAIASGPLAKTFPLVAFTPIFATGTSFFILGETPSVPGLVGILLIVCGAYLLRAENVKTGIFEPVKLLLKEKGSRHMLMAAFLFSFLAVFFKKAILSSSPFFAFGVTQLLSALFLTVFFLKKKTIGTLLSKTANNFKPLFIAGIIGFLAGLTLFAAFQFGLAAYVVSVKRISILLTIILGYIFFKEDHLIRSLIVGSIMVLGIFLISLG
ncbi:MAG: DMT family transporter [Anaerohalosphaeraceae bacterium]|nr:DMT family transporter [Anaerohalosphaeraceae bacterium]